MALISQIPVLTPIIQTLQALYACPSARKAVLQFRPVDDRIAQGLGDYYTGSSPANLPYRNTAQYHTLDAGIRPAFEAMWRLQILFAFCTSSTRACCNPGDLVANIPQDILRKNSKGELPVQVVSAYFDHLVGSFYDAFRFHSDVKADSFPAEEGWEALKSTFHLLEASCHEIDRSSGDARPREEQQRTRIRLEPNGIASTVTSALEAALSSKYLAIRRNTKVLALSVHPQSQTLSPSENFMPFKVEPTVYLDRFMWERRIGLTLGQTERLAIQRGLAAVETLEKRRRELTYQENASTLDMLRRSIEYFLKICKRDEEPMRASQQAEAVGALQQVLDKLTTEIARIDSAITKEKTKIADLQRKMQEEQEAEFNRPEWRKHPTHLRAVFMNDSTGTSWVYFQHRGGWFKSQDGGVDRVESIDVVLKDHRGAESLRGVYFLLYDVDEDEDADLVIPEELEVSRTRSDSKARETGACQTDKLYRPLCLLFADSYPGRQ